MNAASVSATAYLSLLHKALSVTLRPKISHVEALWIDNEQTRNNRG